ncbi:LysM repeat protein [Arthrobacter pigmenti]|uniref:LysM repeat protein n=1 Tax=Arthrobacter pigmenti TaxID=271432 RepID=A0A846RN76_9MICC|nr:lytic transglycosylase domain-containing protein [Arthrobacter pigmenti]NJC22072.1 LysM repeat protein [Arthrobacter pigmenti]
MTAQRPSSPLNASAACNQPSKNRGINIAVSTAAIPAVVLSSVALAAAPAAAAPAPSHTAYQPLKYMPVIKGPNAALVPAALVASQVPRVMPMQSTPATYVVRSGDTISGIATRHGLKMHDVLKLNGLNISSIIHPGQKIKLSGSPSTPTAPKKESAEANTPAGTYTVKPGDTLGGIAARHNVSLGSVLQANGLSMSSIIHPGQKIRVGGAATPAPAPKPAAPKPAAPKPSTESPAETYTVKPGDTLGAIAARHGVSLGTVLSANGLSMNSIIHPGQKIKLGAGSSVAVQSTPPAKKPAPAQPSGGQYTIRAGDTLGAIAARHGISLSALLSANKLTATTIIHPGKKLTIPGAAKAKPEEKPADLVPNTFLHYTYPDAVVAEANKNKHTLNGLPVPSQAQMQAIVADTARNMGVDPSLALAFSYQESGFNQRAVSPANAIGAMQVIPMSGEWASDLVGRKLNLLDPYDNATAGVAIIRALIRTSPNLDDAIASYYQGQYSVQTHGMFADTKNYVAAIKAHQKNFR